MSGTVPSPPPPRAPKVEPSRGWITRNNLPSWIAAVATAALAIVAWVEFPPAKRISELETRETALLNRTVQLEKEGADAERRKAEAERQIEAALAEAEGLQFEIRELGRQRDDLRDLVDLQKIQRRQLTETLKEKDANIQEARNRLERAEAEALDAQASFRRYVVGLTLIRVRGFGLSLALEALNYGYNDLRNVREENAPWPFEVWGLSRMRYSPGAFDAPVFGKPSVLQDMLNEPGSHGWDMGYFGSYNWGHTEFNAAPGIWKKVMTGKGMEPPKVTGTNLVHAALISVEFRELPKPERSRISRQIQEFVDARKPIFDANLALAVEYTAWLKLVDDPVGTTGDEEFDQKIVAELQRHEVAHREIAAALKELEGLLLSITGAISTRE